MNKHDIPIIYTNLSSIPNFMDTITKVFINADSILVNGTVVSSCGTAMLACLADNYKVPCIVFCETYKLS